MSCVGTTSKLYGFFQGINRPITADGPPADVVQKICYLAQRHGIDLGYDFEWYINGPYCRQISVDIDGINNGTIFTATDDMPDKPAMTAFIDLFSSHINNVKWMEMAACILYMRYENRAEMPLSIAAGYVVEDLLHCCGTFDEDLVWDVIRELHKMQLLL